MLPFLSFFFGGVPKVLLLPPAASARPRISAGGSSERSSFAATFLPGTLWWLPPRVCAQRRSGCFGALPPGTRLVYRAPSRGAGRGRPRETIPRPPRAPPYALVPRFGGAVGRLPLVTVSRYSIGWLPPCPPRPCRIGWGGLEPSWLVVSPGPCPVWRPYWYTECAS